MVDFFSLLEIKMILTISNETFLNITRYRSKNGYKLAKPISNRRLSGGSHGRTLGRLTMKSSRRTLGHLPICSIICSPRSLIRSIRTAGFAHVHRCAQSLAHSLTHLLPTMSLMSVESNVLNSYGFNPLCARPWQWVPIVFVFVFVFVFVLCGDFYVHGFLPFVSFVSQSRFMSSSDCRFREERVAPPSDLRLSSVPRGLWW